jgi:hypothetical protein
MTIKITALQDAMISFNNEYTSTDKEAYQNYILVKIGDECHYIDSYEDCIQVLAKLESVMHKCWNKGMPK